LTSTAVDRRARDKARRLAKERGESGYVDPAPTTRRIRRLYDDLGISFVRIAEVAGVDVGNVKRYYLGHRMDRDRSRVIWCTIEFEKRIREARFRPTDRTKFPAVGIRRRLQALQAAGFSMKFVAPELDESYQYLHKTMMGQEAVYDVAPERARKVIALYEKLENSTPADHGVNPTSVKQNITRGKAKRYAPPSCWDPDTIDDPDAIPEWTGACGSPEGLRIHYRDGIPACRPCLDTRSHPESRSPESTFSGAKLTRIRKLRGLEIRELAEKLGVDKGTVYYWETSRSAPRTKSRVEQLCAVLGCNEIDLCEE